MKTKKIKLGQLKFDEKLLALRPVNIFVVSEYRQAYRSGAHFPPIAIEAKTNRITSGNHRVTAMLKEFGPDYEIEVIVKEYASEKDLLMEFVRENVSHGWRLDGISKKRLAIALSNQGATPEEMAILFNVPVKQLIHWGQETVAVIGGNGQQEIMPAKQGMQLDKTVTREQYDEHQKRDLGIPPDKLADQLIRWLRNDWIERNEVNLASLQTLYKALEGFLAKGDVVAAMPAGAGVEGVQVGL